MKVAILSFLAVISIVSAQPFLPGQGVGPLGTWRTTDAGGPYNISLLSVQANEVAAGGAARGNFTDKDIVDFLVNVECLEGSFDTWGAFGHGFIGNLNLGGPQPIGARKANLSATNLPYAQEVALNEQGHALFTRQAGGANPCPVTDVVGGFNQFFARAFGLNETIEQAYGSAFDPFLNDQNFFLSVVTLEELGATGNKGLTGLISNPVIANGVAGLATSATAQATIERFVLWNLKNEIVQPFGETVQQVYARMSALRDQLGGTSIDQGLVNSDPRFIAVPANFINLIPTDVRGLTFNRSPQQVINIVTIGNGTLGGFFPNGLYGAINSSAGYMDTGNGLANFPSGTASQAPSSAVGTVSPPINGSTPNTVPGIYDLTQAITSDRSNSSYVTRGYFNAPAANPNLAPGPSVTVATSSDSGSQQSAANAGK